MSNDVAALVSDNLDLWTSAIERKSGAGRGGGKKVSHYGVVRLRALILDLAVRGKLVPQDAEDESAAALLTRIDGGRTNLINDGFIRGAKAAVDRTKITGAYPIPPFWAWVRLDRLGAIVGGGTPSAADSSNFTEPGQGIAWLTPADLSGFEEKFIGRGQRDLTDKGTETSSAKVMPAGTVLFTSRAPIGYVAIAANDLATNQGFKSIVPSIDGLSEFIALFLKASAEEIDANAPGTTFKEVSGKIVSALPFPLPPLAEQQRIVAKVDELMALCDALEVQSASALEAHQTLVESLLATLIDATDPADLAQEWARLETHFDTLFTTEPSVDCLKQTVLELAVRGKLTVQDGADEPAGVMLASAKKAALKAGGKVKFHSAITQGEHPFELPATWHWERFDNLIEPEMPISYGVLVPGNDEQGGVPFVRIADLSINNPSHLPEKAISADVDAQYERTRLRGGEILMGVVGSIGKLGVAPDSWAGANIARAVCRIVPSGFIDRNYVLWLLQSRFMQNNFRADTRTLAQPTLNLGLIRLAATPVPPFAEQQRIVAKIDSLMALCDALKAGVTDAAQTLKHLADAVVERAAA